MDGPQKIISLISSGTEILAGLGVESRLQAISHECDFPFSILHLPRVTRSWIDQSASSDEIDRQVKKRAHQGQPLYQLDADRICQLAPELIVTQAQCDVCSVRYEDVVQLVGTRAELAETSLLALSPQSLADVFEDIGRVATAVAAADRAGLWLSAMQVRLSAIEQQVKHRASPTVACIEWIEPMMLAGNWVPELVKLAGGESVLAEAGMHSQYHEWDSLVAEDPDVLLIAPCGFDLERSLAESERLVGQAGWEQLSAVREKRVFVLDGNSLLNRPGPRLVETVEIMAQLIHPQLEMESASSLQSLARRLG